MRKPKTITKTSLVWEATKKPLQDVLGAAGACAVLVLLLGSLARLFDSSLPSVVQLLKISAFAGIMIAASGSLAGLACCISSLRLLKRQEKSMSFSFSKEQLTWEKIGSDWYIHCEWCRVIVVRRAYIIAAGQIQKEYKLLCRMKVKDMTGSVFFLKGTFQQLEGLKNWLKDGSEQHGKQQGNGSASARTICSGVEER